MRKRHFYLDQDVCSGFGKSRVYETIRHVNHLSRGFPHYQKELDSGHVAKLIWVLCNAKNTSKRCVSDAMQRIIPEFKEWFGTLLLDSDMIDRNIESIDIYNGEDIRVIVNLKGSPEKIFFGDCVVNPFVTHYYRLSETFIKNLNELLINKNIKQHENTYGIRREKHARV